MSNVTVYIAGMFLRYTSARTYQGKMSLNPEAQGYHLTNRQHMNHSTAFHTLRRQLSAEVAALQCKGYYGDGESLIGFSV